ncbi:MAG: tetratricopeptide repeat protein, partial [Candidatus Odinarchaeota archaeon]
SGDTPYTGPSRKKRRCRNKLENSAKLRGRVESRRSGREKEGLSLLQEIEELLEKHRDISHSDKLKIEGEIHSCKGSIHIQLGNLDSSIKHFRKSIEIKKDDNDEHLASAYNGLGISFCSQGNLNSSLKYLKQALANYVQLKNQSGISTAYNNIGVVYELRGEYELAIECYEISLAIQKELGNKLVVAVLKANIGSTCIPLEDYQKALKFLKESLELIQEVHNDYHYSNMLVLMIDLLLAADFESEDVKKYLEQLEKLHVAHEDNLLIKTRYECAKALVLKTNDRLIDKMKAQAIFEQIVQSKVLKLDITVRALLNLVDLLLLEFKSTENVEILHKVEQLITRLLTIGKEQKNYLVQIKALLLKSKLEVLNLRITEAEEFLEQAKLICEDKGLTKLTMAVIEEQESLISKRKDWKDLVKEKISYQERLELTEIDTTLTRMIKNRLEVIDEYDEIVGSFTVDKISFIVFKFSNAGADVALSLNVPESDEFGKCTAFMAVSFITMLGQGDQYHEGLFGPFPIPVKGYSSIIFSKVITDSTQTDRRLSGKNYSLFCIIYPQQFSMLFFDRKAITEIFNNRLEEIDDLANITGDFLENLREDIYKKLTELVVSKDLEANLAE